MQNVFKLIDIVTSKHGRVDSELSRFLKIAQLDDRAGWDRWRGGRDRGRGCSKRIFRKRLYRNIPLSAALCSCKRGRLSDFLRKFAERIFPLWPTDSCKRGLCFPFRVYRPSCLNRQACDPNHATRPVCTRYEWDDRALRTPHPHVMTADRAPGGPAAPTTVSSDLQACLRARPVSLLR